jgi:DNA-binding transcriptional ArsR family regulator
VFHALSSAPRRKMLGSLADGERTVGDLADPFDISLAAVSKHVKVLEAAGLVERRGVGPTSICRPRAEPLAEVGECARWLGPDDFTVTVATVEERVGGSHHIEMIDADGGHHMSNR